VLGENEMKPNSRLPQNVRLSEWLGLAEVRYERIAAHPKARAAKTIANTTVNSFGFLMPLPLRRLIE